MNTRLLIIVFILSVIPGLAFAQGRRYAGSSKYQTKKDADNRLIIFSPDEEPFFLILNGKVMNDHAETNIAVEGLPYDVYRVEIEFEDVRLPVITDDIDISRKRLPSDGVYKIGWTRNDKPILVPASYGFANKRPYTVQYREQRTPGSDPFRCRQMPARDFEEARQAIKNVAFDDTRLSTAKGIACANSLSAEQATEICRIFSFEQTRVEFAKYAYNFVIDPANYYKINKAFNFSSSIDELNSYIYGR